MNRQQRRVHAARERGQSVQRVKRTPGGDQTALLEARTEKLADRFFLRHYSEWRTDPGQFEARTRDYMADLCRAADTRFGNEVASQDDLKRLAKMKAFAVLVFKSRLYELCCGSVTPSGSEQGGLQ